jgi:hypothetical protein
MCNPLISGCIGLSPQIHHQPLAFFQDGVDFVGMSQAKAGRGAGADGREAHGAEWELPAQMFALGLPAGEAAGLTLEIVECVFQSDQAAGKVLRIDEAIGQLRFWRRENGINKARHRNARERADEGGIVFGRFVVCVPKVGVLVGLFCRWHEAFEWVDEAEGWDARWVWVWGKTHRCCARGSRGKHQAARGDHDETADGGFGWAEDAKNRAVEMARQDRPALRQTRKRNERGDDAHEGFAIAVDGELPVHGGLPVSNWRDYEVGLDGRDRLGRFF